MQSTTKKTPFYSLHQEMGGRMVPFAGYEMPVQFSGIKDEHMAVRKAVGIFDVSHMGEVFVRGKDALSFCQKITSNDVSRIAPGGVQYTLLCNPNGGIVDDVLLYQFSPTEFFFCVNASNRHKDYKWIKDAKEKENVTIEDESDSFCQLAIQGPKSKDLVKAWNGFDLDRLSYYHFTPTKLKDVPGLIISKTGYTGEDGVELYFKNKRDSESIAFAKRLFELGSEFGIKPCGLGCRDTLRLEMGYSLYGHEINDVTNPFEATLSWVVRLNKPSDFIGKKSLINLKEKGIKKTTIGLLSESPQPLREKLPVYYKDCEIGTVTSGSYSPILQKGFGLARVPIQLSDGSVISDLINKQPPLFAVDIRGKKCPVTLVRPPFVAPTSPSSKN